MHLRDLVGRSGVPAATIKYYLRAGLLPPGKAGRRAVYGQVHLDRLKLIARLRETGLTIEAIGAVVRTIETQRRVRREREGDTLAKLVAQALDSTQKGGRRTVPPQDHAWLIARGLESDPSEGAPLVDAVAALRDTRWARDTGLDLEDLEPLIRVVTDLARVHAKWIADAQHTGTTACDRFERAIEATAVLQTLTTRLLARLLPAELAR